MPTRVPKHTSTRAGKAVTVKAYSRNTTPGETRLKFRSVNSSFIDRISQNPDGGYTITIKGRDYPYPFLPNEKVGGLINGHGKYYNKQIRGNYF